MEIVEVHPILEEDRSKHLWFIYGEEDGLLYNGVIEALKEYCEEMGCNVGEVIWKVKSNPDKDTLLIIKAQTFEEWEDKFNKLKIKWEI